MTDARKDIDRSWRVVSATMLVSAIALTSGAVWNLGTTTGLQLAVGLFVAFTIPLFIYRSRRWATPAGALVLLAVWTVMGVLAISNINQWLTPPGATAAMPALHSDDMSYYKWALHYYDGRVPAPHVAFPGLPVMILVTWKVLGVSVVWPVVMNVMFTLTAFVFTSFTTVRLLRHRAHSFNARTLGTLAIAGCALLGYLISQGTVVLKEASVAMSMAVIGSVMAVFVRERHLSLRHYAGFVIACVVLAFTRTTYMYLVMLALVIVALGNVKSRVPHVTLLLGLAIAAFVAGDSVAYYSFERHMVILSGGERMQRLFIVGESQQPYLNLIGDYFNYPIWRRILLLPLTSAVQFIIPFPWTYDREIGITEMVSRAGYGWYAVGGMALFYYALMSWRRRYTLGAWAWMPAVVFMAIAYVSAGSVSRYATAVQPWFVPIAVWVVSAVRHDSELRRKLRWWALAYVVVLAVTLVVCYRIQINYLRSLDEYYIRLTREMQSSQIQ